MPTGAISSAATAAAVSATVHDDARVPTTEAPSRGRRDRRSGANDAAAAVSAAPAPAKGAAPVSTGEARGKVRWYWRLLAWIVAVPLGFVVTAWPAYHFGWIKKDDLLDVFVGSGNGRYTRLVVLTLAWALVTAVLVQLFVEGGRWLARRRRSRKAAGGGTPDQGPGDKGNGGGTGDARSRRPAGAEGAPGPSAAPPTRRPATSGRR